MLIRNNNQNRAHVPHYHLLQIIIEGVQVYGIFIEKVVKIRD